MQPCISSYEISDKMHCSLLSDHKEVQPNTTHEEGLLDTSITVNETNNMNAETENYRNLTSRTGNGNKHQQNKKKNSEQEKYKTPNEEQKKRKLVVILGDSMVKHRNGWEMSK